MTEIIGLISELINPGVLALMAVTGYLTFLLFFYNTNHWKERLNWGDRFLMGFIIGLLLFTFLNSISSLPDYWLLRMRGSSLPPDLGIFILAVSFLVFIWCLFCFRSKNGNSLRGTSVSKSWSDYFEKFKLKYLIEFYLFLAFFLFWVHFNYPFSEFLFNRWVQFFFRLGFGSFCVYSLLPTLLSILTDLPEVKFYTFSTFLIDVKKINVKSLVKTSVLILMLFLLAFLITKVDSNYGVITSQITMEESVNIIGDVVYFLRYSDNSTTVISKNTRTWHIFPPLIPDVSITYLQISNPSNYSSLTDEFQNRITCSDGLSCTLSSNEKTLNIKIDATNKKDLFFTMDYYSAHEASSIVRFVEENNLTPIELANGTKVQEYYFDISNICPYIVRLESVDLLTLFRGYNITTYSYDIDWTPEQNGYCSLHNYDTRFYLTGVIEPETSFSIKLKIGYTEG
jgi:hypothetical protein